MIDRNSVRFRFRPKLTPEPTFRFRFLQYLRFRFKYEPKIAEKNTNVAVFLAIKIPLKKKFVFHALSIAKKIIRYDLNHVK